MKKAVSLILSLVIMLTGCFSLLGFADDKEVNFTVMTDIHALDEKAELEVNWPENELYFHAKNSGNLYWEAIGILVNALNCAKEQGLDFVLIPGDMTNNGTEDEHTYFASIIDNFTEESGIPVYVTPGNHDYKHTTPDEFKKYYSSSFDKALTVDDKTASYTADLSDDYRLIAIDTNEPGKDGDGVDDRLLDWVYTQTQQAKEDGKTIIAMMHHPLLDPIPYAETLMKDFILRNHEDIAESFTQWGIQYVFTGHEHGNNVASFTGSNGKTVYDILTTALTSYPLEYRVIKLTPESMEIHSETIEECNFDYLTDGYNEAQLQLMESDYTEYSKGYFKYSIQKKISKYITADFLCKKLKVTDGAVYDALQTVMPIVGEALEMPLYSKDTDGTSVESLAKQSGVSLPESDYTSLFDLATSVVAAVYYGAEDMPFDSSPEEKILIIGLNTMLKYILAEAGNRTATLALNAIAENLGLDEIEGVDIFRWNRALALNSEHSYEIAYSVLSPILDKFTVDDELCDRDVTLPGPAAESETVKAETLMDRISAIFRYLLNILKTIFYIKF